MVTTTDDLDPKDEELEAPAVEASDEQADTTQVAMANELEKQLARSDDAHASKMKQMFALLAKQPKETVRVPKAAGPQSVIINGARFNLPAGIPVKVPQQVADLLRDAEII